jgi:hypothetical protein
LPLPPVAEAPSDFDVAEPAAGLAEVKPQPADDGPPFALPGVAEGGWDQVAGRFLRALESLDEIGIAHESVWVRLAFWTLAAAGSVALYELAREQIREPREEDAEPDPLEPSPEPRLR